MVPISALRLAASAVAIPGRQPRVAGVQLQTHHTAIYPHNVKSPYRADLSRAPGIVAFACRQRVWLQPLTQPDIL